MHVKLHPAGRRDARFAHESPGPNQCILLRLDAAQAPPMQEFQCSLRCRFKLPSACRAFAETRAEAEIAYLSEARVDSIGHT